MTWGPFQIARRTLFAGFTVMVLIVSLPNPEPSADWKIAETRRYQARFPELLAEKSDERNIKELDADEPANPIRTARLPIRENNPRRSKPSVEHRDSKNPAPDPIPLD